MHIQLPEHFHRILVLLDKHFITLSFPGLFPTKSRLISRFELKQKKNFFEFADSRRSFHESFPELTLFSNLINYFKIGLKGFPRYKDEEKKCH